MNHDTVISKQMSWIIVLNCKLQNVLHFFSFVRCIFKTAIRQQKYLGKKITLSSEYESRPAMFSKTLYITDIHVLKLKINIIILIIIKLEKFCSVLSLIENNSSSLQHEIWWIIYYTNSWKRVPLNKAKESKIKLATLPIWLLLVEQ